MSKGLVAHVSTTINAPKSSVWNALVSPSAIKQYMFGTDVKSSWQPGSPIVWKGAWQGKPYEDKGQIVRVEPGVRLEYTHFSPLAGLPDRAENYHTVAVELAADGGETRVSLSQDNNGSDEARAHSEQNWTAMLDGLKKYVEGEEQRRSPPG